ncbi:alpha/beta fold hydrolase [Rhizobium sp. PAMB 3174]
MKKLRVRGYEFSYICEGNGPPLVFIHGSALDLRYWNDAIKGLSDSYHCIAPSRRFHWPVPTDHENVPYRAQDQIEDMIAFIDALGLGPVHLVGHSYGGYLAASLAGLRPDLTRSLILMEPGGSAEGQRPARSLAEDQKEALLLLQAGETRKGVARYLDSVCGGLKWEERLPELKAISLANASSILLQMQDKSRPPLSATLLGAVKAPTLVLVGSMSPSPFPTIAERVNELVPDSQLVQVRNAAHLINQDNLEEFLVLVEGFLRDIQA